jgi:S-adenosylmethionine-dependent methyltransferase
MRRTFFKSVSDEFLASPEGQQGVEAQALGRYEEVLGRIVPWVARHIDLANAEVLEIGCGAGASTAGFARSCRHIVGYDIDADGIDGARLRMEILGITNAQLYCVPPESLLSRARADNAGGVQVVLCYAVLEHQTLPERLETIRTCWDLLRPGGLFVVADTPNRLTYMDHHTSFLPFYHMLPHDLAVAYAGKSTRPSFGPAINARLAESESAAVETVIRWGRGVSYHEFELVLGDLSGLVVGDGFDPEILPLKSVTLEERLLYTYATARGLKIPPGFWRESLDVIMRKPDPARPMTPVKRVPPITALA